MGENQENTSTKSHVSREYFVLIFDILVSGIVLFMYTSSVLTLSKFKSCFMNFRLFPCLPCKIVKVCILEVTFHILRNTGATKSSIRYDKHTQDI
jgi:hypothetical protein